MTAYPTGALVLLFPLLSAAVNVRVPLAWLGFENVEYTVKVALGEPGVTVADVGVILEIPFGALGGLMVTLPV